MFKTALIKPIEVEAALTPLEIRLNFYTKQYIYRLAKILPKHLVNLEFNKLYIHKQKIETIAIPKRKPFKPIQLDWIKESICKVYKPSSLEKIQHFSFPLWKKETPYKVNISHLSKEEAASFYKLAIKYRNNNSPIIYTNALSIKKGIEVGIGIVVIQSNGQITYEE